MTYVSRMQNVSAGLIGEGQLVYSTVNMPNMPLSNHTALLQFQQIISPQTAESKIAVSY